MQSPDSGQRFGSGIVHQRECSDQIRIHSFFNPDLFYDEILNLLGFKLGLEAISFPYSSTAKVKKQALETK